MMHRIISEVPSLNTVLEAMKSVVLIAAETEEGATAVGAGFWVKPWFVLTSAHVVHDRIQHNDGSYEFAERTDIRVRGNPGAGFSPLPWDAMEANLGRVSHDDDLVLLEVTPPHYEIEPQALELATVAPNPTETVWALGNPLGMAWDFAEGSVRHTSRTLRYWRRSQPVWGLDVSINPGNSGGPLVNRDGECVGVACAGAPGYNDFTFAVPLQRIKQFLAR
jgi:S1-C subfamily serine protease